MSREKANDVGSKESKKIESSKFNEHPFYIFGYGIVVGVMGFYAIMTFAFGKNFVNIPYSEDELNKSYIRGDQVLDEYYPIEFVEKYYIHRDIIEESYIQNIKVEQFYVRLDRLKRNVDGNEQFVISPVREYPLAIADPCERWESYEFPTKNIHRTTPYPILDGRAYLYSFGWPNLKRVELYVIKSTKGRESSWTDWKTGNVIHKFSINGIVDKTGRTVDRFTIDGCYFIGFAHGLPSEDNDAQSFQFTIRSTAKHYSVMKNVP